MKVDSCGGQCCAVFPYPSSPDEMRRRWTDDTQGDVSLGDHYNGLDELMLADMLIPLTHDEARERAATFGINPEFVDEAINGGYDKLYTCKNWNEETRECGVYESRPDMCATYPYGSPCYHCSESGGCKPQTGWRKRKAQDSNPSALNTVTVSNRSPAPQGSPSE